MHSKMAEFDKINTGPVVCVCVHVCSQCIKVLYSSMTGYNIGNALLEVPGGVSKSVIRTPVFAS